jgi:hypothetical protein
VANIQQFFYTADSVNPRWNRPGDGEMYRIIDMQQREFHFFFKDDWRVTPDLTLNLGGRWEYYGLPWERSGMTAGVRDQIDGMRGVSRNLRWMDSWDNLRNFTPDYVTYGTQQIFIGPNSGNPDVPVYNKDLNNWAPHVGFAWQLPWFGRGRTTLRGGYSISYTSIGNFTAYRTNIALQPGQTYNYSYTGEDFCLSPTMRECYIDFSNVGNLLPLDMAKTGQFPMGHPDRVVSNHFPMTAALNLYDPNVRNPYVQNLNLSLTRTLNNFMTLDLRYIGTLSRKGVATHNLNTPNYFNNGLFGEFEKLRSGGFDLRSQTDFPILNSGIIPYRDDPNGSTTASLFAGTPTAASGLPMVFNDGLSGAEQLLFHQFTNIARGYFETVATNLRTANFHTTLTTAGLRPVLPPNEGAGQVLRAGNAPDNLIRANPQYTAVNVLHNRSRSNYHSMQTQFTLRPYYGLNFQATWTWSRNLTRGGYMDYRDGSPYAWEQTYGLSGQHRTHTFNIFGTYELPFGARGFLFRNVSGALQKAIEGWQLGWIGRLSTGTAMSMNGISTVWGTNRPVQVAPFDTKATGIRWVDTWDEGGEARGFGTFFDTEYTWIPDPQCFTPGIVEQGRTNIFAGGNTLMSGACSSGGSVFATAHLDALVVAVRDENGNLLPEEELRNHIVFQNALPGQIGNRNGSNLIYGPGTWDLDMSMSKSVEFMEGKRLEFRMDAQNIFNHARPTFGPDEPVYYGARNTGVSPPYVLLNDGWNRAFRFGMVNGKTGHRTFQARIRLSF